MAVQILVGDCRQTLAGLEAGRFHTCVTSPRAANGQFVKGVHPWREPKPHWQAEWLREQYVALTRSAAEIAADCGCTENTILFWLAKHGIPRRSVSEARSVKHWGVSGEANPMHGKTGELNPNYVDGSSPERQRMYARGEGKAFRLAVLQRDRFCCCRCGAGSAGPRSLHVHHLRPWAGNEALRFDLVNAATLCRTCHSWVHSNANTAREWLS